VEDVSSAVADKPAAPKVKTPEQLAKMLATACRGISKVLVIVLLDIEERYIMTQQEARDIADPAARMLMRIKALRKPIKWLTGNSDELDLLVAIGKYGMRLVDPVSKKIEVARTASGMKAQMRSTASGTTVTPKTPVTAANNGARAADQQPAGQPAGGSVEFAGFAPEPLEAGAFLIPGVGFGFSN
jgi:hypothetical protein